MFGSVNTTLIFSYEKTDDIMKITKSLEESGLFIQDVSEVIKNEAKKQKRGFLRMLLGTLGTISSGNLLTGQAKIRVDQSF